MIDPYSTHQKALTDALFANPGPVIELGCGYFSTPIIRAVTKGRGDKFTIVSSNRDWSNEFADQCDELVYIDNWAKWKPTEKYSVCLLDNEQLTWERYKHLPILLQHCKCVVVHDADRYLKFEGWDELLNNHHHTWYKQNLPYTISILSTAVDKPTKRYVVVYRTGGDFSKEHVNWLISQLDGEVFILTDSDFFDIDKGEVISLKYKWPGWWSKMEMFRPGILNFPFIYIDLDTIIRSIPDHWFVGDKLMSPLPFSNSTGDIMQSGFMFIPQSVKNQIWSRWIQDPDKYMHEFRGDQDFIADTIKEIDYFPSDDISSFKFTPAKNVSAKVVCFHGIPRPWDVFNDDSNKWIPPVKYLTKEKTYIVVGNGPSILKQEMGDLIDQYDEVIRINTFRIAGFEKYTGVKTTTWVTFGKNALPFDKSEPENVIIIHEESVTPYTPQKVWKIPRSYYDAIRKEIQATTLKTENVDGLLPSTGYLVIRWVMDHEINVTVTGFDHFSKRDNKKHHYWSPVDYKEPAEHDGEAERRLLGPYKETGRLKYLG